MTGTAAIILRAALLVLPPGPVRERYRRELDAELHDLEAHHQWRHALRFLASAWALRRAVTGQDVLLETAARIHDKPLHCRLHLYHHYRLATTDNGHRYLRCRDCGQDYPGTGNGPADVSGTGVLVLGHHM